MTKTDPATIRYDAHCHILSHELFFKRNLIHLIDAGKNYTYEKLLKSPQENETEKDKSDRLRFLKLLELLLGNDDGEETFNHLRNQYSALGSGITGYLPLMVDFEYLFRRKYKKSGDSNKQKKMLSRILDEFNELREKVKKMIQDDGPDNEKDKW